jgi:hypothetical protein
MFLNVFPWKERKMETFCGSFPGWRGRDIMVVQSDHGGCGSAFSFTGGITEVQRKGNGLPR